MPEAENPPQCRYLPDASRPVAARGPSGGGTGICSLPNRDKRRCHSEKRSRPALRAAAHRRRIHGSFRIRSAQPAKKTELAKKQRKMYLPQMLRRPSFSEQAAGPASRLFRRMSPGVRRKKRSILSAAQPHPACFMMHPQPFRQKVPPRFPQQTRTPCLPFPAFHRHSL